MRTLLVALLLSTSAAAASVGTFDYSLGGQAITPPGWVSNASLAAGTAKTFVIPSGAKRVMFSATGNFRASYTPIGSSDVVATIPAGDVTDGSASELNPLVRNVSQFSKLSLVAPASCDVTLSFFAS